MPSISSDSLRPQVFYDGVCPMCRREIAHYRRIDRAAQIDWVEIQTQPERLQAVELSAANALQRFHLLDAQGQWQTGAYGFVEMWAHLPGYRYLAGAIRLLRLQALLDWGYVHVTRWRLRKKCTEQCSL